MKTREKVLQGKPEDDPEWVKEIVSFASACKKQKITDEGKKLLRDLYFEYLRDGLKPKNAMEKAKNVLASFKIQK